MTLRPLRPVNARGQLVTSELGRMDRAVERHDRKATAGGVLLGRNAGGPLLLGRPPRKIWTRVVRGINPYAHQQQKVFLESGALAVSDHLEGISGTLTDLPLFEINSNTTVSDGTVVRARLGLSNDHYLFDECCGRLSTLDEDIPSGDHPSGLSGSSGTPPDRYAYLSPCCPDLILPSVLTLTLAFPAPLFPGAYYAGTWELPFSLGPGFYVLRFAEFFNTFEIILACNAGFNSGVSVLMRNVAIFTPPYVWSGVESFPDACTGPLSISGTINLVGPPGCGAPFNPCDSWYAGPVDFTISE